MSISDTVSGVVEFGERLALLVGEGVVLSLGLFLAAEKSLESLPLPFGIVLLKVSSCSKEKSIYLSAQKFLPDWATKEVGSMAYKKQP